MRTLLFALALLLVPLSPLGAAEEPEKGFSPAYSNLLRDAMRCVSQRDFPTALALLDKADAMYPATPMSLNTRGAIFIEEKRYEEGRKLCLDALQKDPSFFPARFNLAEIPFVQSKYAEARHLFEKLREDHRKDDLIKFRIYLTYLLEKDDSAAKDALERIPFLSNSPIYYYSQAAWSFAHGDEKEALDWIDRANWVFPPHKTQNYADVFCDLGWVKRPEPAAPATPAGP